MPRIDVHAHYMNNEYLALLEECGNIEPGVASGRAIVYPSHEADLEARFRVMDRAGVDRQILSASGLMPYFANTASGVRTAHYLNDLYAQLVTDHPLRFEAFGSLPLPHIQESLAELTRCLDDLHFVGISLATSVLGKSLGDPTFDPVYAELDRRAAILFIHPAGLACGSAEIRAEGLLWPLGGTAEDTLCAVQLMTSGFTEKYPRVRCILPHLGGTLPFLMHRLERIIRAKLPDKAALASFTKKFWYDSVNGFGPALRCACEVFGADRIVLGSDYPFFRDDDYQWQVDYLASSGLSEADVTAIRDENVRRLFEDIYSGKLFA
jgi:aminocarboxymuconate-semialdehyde decarboxylase